MIHTRWEFSLSSACLLLFVHQSDFICCLRHRNWIIKIEEFHQNQQDLKFVVSQCSTNFSFLLFLELMRTRKKINKMKPSQQKFEVSTSDDVKHKTTKKRDRILLLSCSHHNLFIWKRSFDWCFVIWKRRKIKVDFLHDSSCVILFIGTLIASIICKSHTQFYRYAVKKCWSVVNNRREKLDDLQYFFTSDDISFKILSLPRLL